jgi:hypothetical protein
MCSEGCSCAALEKSYDESQAIIARINAYCQSIMSKQTIGMSGYLSKEDWEKDDKSLKDKKEVAKHVIDLIEEKV